MAFGKRHTKSATRRSGTSSLYVSDGRICRTGVDDQPWAQGPPQWLLDDYQRMESQQSDYKLLKETRA
jgi:hypothetical protein